MRRVSDIAPKVTRSTEASFERRFADRLSEMGIYSRHMSDHVPGLPDRYVVGGVWIEFKSLYRAKSVFTCFEGMSPEQHRTAGDLVKAGDQVFWCALLATNDGKKIAFERYKPRPEGYVFRVWGDKRDDIDEIINEYVNHPF